MDDLPNESISQSKIECVPETIPEAPLNRTELQPKPEQEIKAADNQSIKHKLSEHPSTSKTQEYTVLRKVKKKLEKELTNQEIANLWKELSAVEIPWCACSNPSRSSQQIRKRKFKAAQK